MEIAHHTAVKLLQDIGLTHADTYTRSQLINRIRKLPNLVDENTQIATPESDHVYEQLLTAIAAQEPINFGEAPAQHTAPPKMSPANNSLGLDYSEPERPIKDKPKKSKAEKKPAEKKPAAKKPTSPIKKSGLAETGVKATIAKLLLGANKAKPIKFEAIVKALTKAFPDRQPSSMTNTLKVQLGGRLEAERGLKVHKSDKGLWATKPSGKK